ncbi:MAG: UbiA family prenyltransferase [Chloroflexi bacterium]|nr:UbiA family prenyltransferase [Chloroflexota bacterium]
MRVWLQLSRWQEFLPFVVPLTVLGATLGAEAAGQPLDGRLLASLAGNLLAVAYAFMVNDIEDAADDALDATRAARNAVASGRLSARVAYGGCAVVAVAALACYSLGGERVWITGAITLALAQLYSWRPVRLKKWALVDVAAHALMLSALLFLTGYWLYAQALGEAAWLLAAAALLSAYGQLYNQLRDAATDRAAGLRNTTWLLGERGARLAMYGTVVLSAYCVVQALLTGLFPVEAGVGLLLAAPLALLWPRLRRGEARRPRRLDMRGSAAVDLSGALQTPALLLLNGLVAGWLVGALW